MLHPQEDWGDFMTEEIEESFAYNIILRFICLFPRYYREWFDQKSKLTKVSGMIIQSGLEDKILDYQLDQIELSQVEWKSDKFNIHIYKKNREINLIYTVDEVNFEYIIKIPEEYPKKNLIVKSVKTKHYKDT